jgi:hypothetical protein
VDFSAAFRVQVSSYVGNNTLTSRHNKRYCKCHKTRLQVALIKTQKVTSGAHKIQKVTSGAHKTQKVTSGAHKTQEVTSGAHKDTEGYKWRS